MSSSGAKLSFTIRRPSPTSRASSTGADSDSSNFKLPALPRHLSSSKSNHHENGSSGASSPLGRSSPKPSARTYHERDSSDEDDGEGEDELVTGFDQFGVQRLHEKKEPQGPLVIPALKNRDWRELAKKRKMLYVPPSAAAATGADGSVGGLGTRDSINSGPQLSGLQLFSTKKSDSADEGEKMDVEGTSTPATPAEETVKGEEEETEDQRALRAILSGADGTSSDTNATIAIISSQVTEEDAFNQDITALPEPSTLADYENMPVEQFGAALLRGMGWEEGKAASKRKDKNGKTKGMVEPWLPQARPALLGIGAKEMEQFDDGSKGGKGGKKRQDKRYVPLLKVERKRDEEEGGSRSGSSSRRRTPERDGDRDRERDRKRESSSRRRSPDSSDRRRKYDSDREKDYDRERERDQRRNRDSYREKDRERDTERDRDRDGRKDYDYDSSRRRDRSSERYGEASSSRRRIDKDRRD
ncbi:hypothetical protein NLI96_g10427 [Meripilus lineatus]|uniref:G-patch domain-containing protein n=1 Tax=Meripilus lineatus TaxID=2056292 RepID=A0AAD5YEC9_9APHY|nr:hypothetical protein NLI96_g10427 [Physisporinus lineatus]